MTIDDELFFAWLDGELDPDQMAEIGAAVAADPALQVKAAEHRDLQARLQAGFGTLLDAPLPAGLTVASQPAASVVDLSAVRAARTTAPGRSAMLGQWGALAATLCVGLFSGVMLAKGPSGPVIERNGQLIAGNDLRQALDTQLASAPSMPAPVRIGVTFERNDGAVCRSFAGETADGVACRIGETWQIQGLFATARRIEGGYRMASSVNPQVMALVDEMMVGDPFDVAAERHWRDGLIGGQ